MRDIGPPDDRRLQFVELLERTIEAFRRREYLVDVLRLDPVRQQRDLERIFGALAHAALARKFLDVPEIRPALRSVFQPVAVIAERVRPDYRADATVAHRRREELILAAETTPVELFEQSLLATENKLVDLDLDDVPACIAALHFRTQDADAARP